ncbi:hypothetical protein CCHR01_09086 [Colletotrichum chrysophilum]|uniref:Uncharacterized protein n=1 Tax=Colletotrichum chrysophilum TaxID=1836956 RepID=A0AAD9AHP4_9PEZI|nr:hypothetical protein CCHR01_09086 [Colletotrichum chrysophilum]
MTLLPPGRIRAGLGQPAEMTIARRLRLADIDDPVQHFEVAKSKMEPARTVAQARFTLNSTPVSAEEWRIKRTALPGPSLPARSTYKSATNDRRVFNGGLFSSRHGPEALRMAACWPFRPFLLQILQPPQDTSFFLPTFLTHHPKLTNHA